MRRYRVVNKQRFYLFITSLLVIAFAIVSLTLNTKKAHSEILYQDYKEVLVMEGDTLWNIALKHMPDKYDTRYLVYKLKEINNLNSGYIYIGEIIKVPILNE